VTPANDESERIIPLANAALGLQWQPIAGTETRSLIASMRRISDTEKDTLVNEAAGVIGSGKSPAGDGPSRTGLIVGFVQSGKTASFTTVTALARDNEFRLVIVITGVSTNLLGQSNSRLLRDLRIENRDDRSWRVVQNPSLRSANNSTQVSPEEIQAVFDLWARANAPASQRQTLLITVMKNHGHLRNLTNLLSQLRLDGVPTLVIDDEADQAGLNTGVANNNQSPTYRRILELRRTLPDHTYLQYTATPQAPLLVALADSLSPDFVRVLTPGANYSGGTVFFEDMPQLIRVIPVADIVSPANNLNDAPDSFLKALRLFFLGVAAGILIDDAKGNRSMLVHPSQGTLQHGLYYQWTKNIRQAWLAVLRDLKGGVDQRELLEEFRATYADLAGTVGSTLPTFDELAAQLPNALLLTRETEVNAAGGRTPRIEWRDFYGHILVGGQAMDRGFTVEGLTVTYMPRGTGTGMADTIQQRARFFGYKRPYLGYCRVFLEFDVKQAFRSLVLHERAMRAELERHASTGLPLSEWRRQFFLDPRLKPTRDSIVGLPGLARHNYETETFRPRTLYQAVGGALTENRELFARFETNLSMQVDPLGAGTNLRADGVSLAQILGDFITVYRPLDPADSVRITALIIQLNQLLESDPTSTCTIYVMGRGNDRTFLRRRPIAVESGELAATTGIFQGRNAANGYPGDENLPSVPPDRVQIQLHHLALHDGAIDGPVVMSDACVLVCKITTGQNQGVVIEGPRV
jgi:hypothetical protein